MANTANIPTGDGKVFNPKQKFKRNQQLTNPCWKEYNQSFQCLENNLYDYDKCQLHFENYKTCKMFWGSVISERRRNNIKPLIPLPEEREKIKAEYLNSKEK